MKKQTPSASVVLALLVGAAFSVGADTIDFDDIEVPGNFLLAPPNSYVPAGIMFDRPLTIINLVNSQSAFHDEVFVPNGGTTPNGLDLNGFSEDSEIIAKFVVPGTMQVAVTDFVQVHVFDSNVDTLLGTLEAQDVCGNILESVSMTTPSDQFSVYTISTPGIGRIRLFQDDDGGIFDNLTINTPTGFSPPDQDSDGTMDNTDNCLVQQNCLQRDTDGDGFGNYCDADLNNDCIVNVIDLGIFKTVFFTANPDADFDGNGIVNAVDLGILKTSFFAPPGPTSLANICE